jgi:serine/threonine protein kinase
MSDPYPYQPMTEICDSLSNNAAGMRFLLVKDNQPWEFEVPPGSSVCRTLYSYWIQKYPSPMSYEEFKSMLLARADGSTIFFQPPRSVIIIYAADKHTPQELRVNGVVFLPSNRQPEFTSRSMVLFYHSESGPRCAVKLVKRGIDHLFDAKIAQELYRNDQINSLGLSARCADHIVRLIYHETTPDGEYEALVMEAFDTDLAHILYSEHKANPPPFEVVMKLIHAVLYATQCLHDKNIIVTDIKPLNIVLNTAPFKVALIDFDSLTEAGPDGVGTSRYIGGTKGFESLDSILSGVGSFDNDVFAIGMTLYVIITMHEPTPLQNVEDFQSPIYQQTVQQMIDLMNARMWWYTPQQRDIIVRLVLQMIEFVVSNRAKIPALLEYINGYV